MVVSAPWPVLTTVSPGRVMSRERMDLRMVGSSLWDRPVAQPCPKCGAPFLTEKVTKRKGTRLLCVKEGCGYEEVVEAAG